MRIGVYEVTGLLGAGGMGEVYRARDTKLDRDVALKVLPEAFTADPDRLARFEREAKVLASLNHPNIGSIYGLEEAEPSTHSASSGLTGSGQGVRALVLELVEGPTLADRIKQGPIPLDEALPIARQIAEALEAAHEQGVIHRDLKPANIKVKDDATVKVLDFGLAKAFEPQAGSDPAESPTVTAATQQGVILGTAAYMSPEQASGSSVDKRADIWSFGVVLFEMVTGRRPFEGETVAHVLAAVLATEPDWSAVPASCPQSVRRLIRRCLAKDRTERLHDVADARLEIADQSTLDLRHDSSGPEREIASGQPDPASPPVLGAKEATRPRVAIVVAGVVAASMIVAGLAAWPFGRFTDELPVSTVLVLPLDVGDGVAPSLGRIVSETLAVNLALTPTLSVLPVPEISSDESEGFSRAKRLGAGALVTGSLHEQDGQRQVSLQLIDVAENRLRWGSIKDTELTSLTGLASNLAAEIAAQLGATAPRLFEFPLYLHGDPMMISSPEAVATLRAYKTVDIPAALEEARKLVVAYPTAISAHALKGYLLLQMVMRAPQHGSELNSTASALESLAPGNPYTTLYRKPDFFEASLEVSDELLERNDLAPAMRSWMLRQRWNPHHPDLVGLDELAVPKLEEAVRLDPATSWNHERLAMVLRNLGRSDEALPYARRAVDLEPLWGRNQATLLSVLRDLERWEEAESTAERIFELTGRRP